jgi:hypothetical protein
MLRHACGFYLASHGHDTRAIQAYLGHKNIQHTIRYTELSPIASKIFGSTEPNFGSKSLQINVFNCLCLQNFTTCPILHVSRLYPIPRL